MPKILDAERARLKCLNCGHICDGCETRPKADTYPEPHNCPECGNLLFSIEEKSIVTSHDAQVLFSGKL